VTRRRFLAVTAACLAAGAARAKETKPAVERIAILSDEVAPGFGEAAALCAPFGVRAFELRCLDGPRIPDVTDEALDAVLRVAKERDLTLAGISPGLFKVGLDDPAVEKHLGPSLDACFRVMDRLGSRRMTVFSFLRGESKEPGAPDAAIEKLRVAHKRCLAAGVDMQIENVAGAWADTGENLSLVARAVGAKVVWDPGNAAAAGGECFPAGYAAVRDLVGHVHIKDWRPDVGWAILGEGVLDWPGQLAALEADGYEGYYCIESHLKDDRVEVARRNADYLRARLGQKA
jgi:sugar phosphate isomerase/epimerase